MADERKVLADVPRPSRVPTRPGRILLDQMIALQSEINNTRRVAEELLTKCGALDGLVEAIKAVLDAPEDEA